MCGIAGIIHWDGRAVERDRLLAMNRAQRWRGPDGDGVYVDGGVGLGHVRLAILDPAHGAQPFISDDGQVVLVINGEVYNYLELKRERLSDQPFRTSCDTEVVLRAYQQEGIDCIRRFEGMFAFAVLDRRQRRLYLVRDRLGIKPLYYAITDAGLVFASEIGALLASGWVTPAVHRPSLRRYLQWGYVPAPETGWCGVRKLPPAHGLELDLSTGTHRLWRYWQVTPEPVARREDDALDELNALLADVTAKYVRSDVPFGAFLSGGVDSSLVTALMSRQLSEPVRAFSIGFGERDFSELEHAREAAALTASRFVPETLEPPGPEGVAELAAHVGEPFADSSMLPTFAVSRNAAREVKMVLSGDGGDECFAGYRTYQLVLAAMQDPWRPLKRGVRLAADRLPLPDALRQSLRYRGVGLEAIHALTMQIVRPPDLAALGLAPEATADLGLTPADLPDTDPITRCQLTDLATYLVDDILTKVDRMSMANSLEVRVPLLDHRVVEFAFSLPRPQRLRARPGRAGGVEGKVLLRRSAARFYPTSFLDRRKMGFSVPLAAWCRGVYRPWLEDRLRSRAAPLFDHVRFEAVGRILDELFASGSPAAASQAWALLMLDLWLASPRLRPAVP